ncbi:MAG TPA: 50S ribosomal protein L1 [Candidatus Dependentiae bacterium]|nr:50S ribosomal protein L1 [Candidatus Dependentiae bacterium]
MLKHGKKYRTAVKKVQKEIGSSTDQVLDKIKAFSYVNFDESVDVDVNLGIDPSKGEQIVRGSVLLPHGRGKPITIIVFAKGDYADKAQQAGADYVGTEDLVKKINDGWMDFNYAVATPDMMGLVGKLAKILGPRGLLPTAKMGTVTFDVEAIIADLKKGRAFFKNDKQGIVHFSVGKVSFENKGLRQNLQTFLKALRAAKPSAAKGKFLKKISLSSTMGIGFVINPDELLNLE